MPHAFTQTGYRPPEKKDPRNFDLAKAQPISPLPPAYKTDISALPIFNQQKLSDCVENGITYIKKYHEYKTTGQILDLARRSLVIPTVQMDGFPLSQGTSIQDALYQGHKKGISETQYISDDHSLPESVFVSPASLTSAAQANALTHTIYSYAFVSDLSVNSLKNAIYQNGLVAIGATINQNWWTSKSGTVTWNASDILPIRPPLTHDPKIDPSLSGHLFVLYGYDEQYFYFVNSFGDTWGEKGTGYFKMDEVPFIYEAAAIVDLSLIQIQAIKNAQTATNDVENTIHSLPANATSNPVIIAILLRAVNLISDYLKSFFN